MMGKL